MFLSFCVLKQIPTIDGTTHLLFFGCDSKKKINKIQTRSDLKRFEPNFIGKKFHHFTKCV